MFSMEALKTRKQIEFSRYVRACAVKEQMKNPESMSEFFYPVSQAAIDKHQKELRDYASEMVELRVRHYMVNRAAEAVDNLQKPAKMAKIRAVLPKLNFSSRMFCQTYSVFTDSSGSLSTCSVLTAFGSEEKKFQRDVER